MQKKKRINVVLPQESAQRFESLKKNLGFSRDIDVFNSGTRLLESYHEVFANGGMLIYRDKDGKERPYVPLIAIGG